MNLNVTVMPKVSKQFTDCRNIKRSKLTVVVHIAAVTQSREFNATGAPRKDFEIALSAPLALKFKVSLTGGRQNSARTSSKPRLKLLCIVRKGGRFQPKIS